MTISVHRAATEAEFSAAFAMVQALAAHEGASAYLKITEADFISAASGDDPTVYVLLATDETGPVGVATYFQRFHIWNNSNIIELDDLYVCPTTRGKGAGTQLLSAIGATAKASDMAVKWQVQPDNDRAISLYKRMGAHYSASGICFWRPENI